MLPDSFGRTYDRLVVAFKRHQDVPRSSAHVRPLGTARWNLELARKAMRVERERFHAIPSSEGHTAKRVAMSDDDLARLRVQGAGLGH